MTDPRDVYVVILAGGGGTRLWPLSTASSPKFLYDLAGTGRTLLQGTWERARRLAPAEQIIVVTGARLVEQVREQLPEADSANLIGEPSPRDSSAAIGLGAARAEALDPEAVVITLAADHLVGDEAAFAADLAEAAEAARRGLVCAVGITPTYPATGFGYVRMGAEEVPGTRARIAQAFVEKPDAARAREFLADGGYVWNAGVYAGRAGTLLERLDAHTAGWASRLRTLARDAAAGAPLNAWEDQPKVAFDYSVSEPTAELGGVAAVASTAPWMDLGDWSAVHDALQGEGLKTLGDAALVQGDGSGLVVTGGRRVVVIGLDDVAVVDSPHGLLVMPLSRAQDVKAYAAG